MRKRYQLLLLAVLASASACTSEGPKEAAERAAQPPVAATPPAPLPTAEPSVAPVAAALPAPGATRAPLQKRRRANTFASTPEADASAPADTASMTELRQFLQAALPAPQQFTIRPGRDTMLLGSQGTQLLLPANAWDLPDSVTTVQLSVREFYSTADLVLADLNTMAGDQLLETGGMLQITATAAGQPVSLRPNRSVHLRLPAKRAKPGMQTFSGTVQGPDHHIDWQLPANHAMPASSYAKTKLRRDAWQQQQTSVKNVRRDSTIRLPDTQWPAYKALEQSWVSEFRNQYESRERLRRRRNNSYRVQRLLEMYSGRNHKITRLVSFAVTVDSSGMLASVVPNRGSDPDLTPMAQTALLTLKNWQPAYVPAAVQGNLKSERVTAATMLQMLFTKEGQISTRMGKWRVTRASYARSRRLRHEVDSLLADKRFRYRYFLAADSLAAARATKQQAQYEQYQAQAAAELARLRAQFADSASAPLSAGGVYEELSTQGLGWINCDRFTGPMPQVTFNVKVGAAGAITTLLFRNIRSVMRANSLSLADAQFSRVPLGRPATVVSLRRENGITYLATHNLLISPATQKMPDFQPVTIAELRARLKELD